MRLAVGGWTIVAGEDAATVAQQQRAPLCGGDNAAAAAEIEHVTVRSQKNAGDRRITGNPRQRLVRQHPTADDLTISQPDSRTLGQLDDGATGARSRRWRGFVTAPMPRPSRRVVGPLTD